MHYSEICQARLVPTEPIKHQRLQRAGGRNNGGTPRLTNENKLKKKKDSRDARYHCLGSLCAPFMPTTFLAWQRPPRYQKEPPFVTRTREFV